MSCGFVMPTPQYISNWNPADMLLISDARSIADAIGANGSGWRRPTSAEIDGILAPIPASGGEDVSLRLFTLPHHLAESFWSHDLKSWLDAAAASPRLSNMHVVDEKAFAAALHDICQFVEFVDPQIHSTDLAGMVATQPEGGVRVVDLTHQLSLGASGYDEPTGELCAWINVDDQDQHLVATKTYADPPKAGDTTAFAEPLIFRLHLAPNEGVIWRRDLIRLGQYFDDTEQVYFSIGIVKRLA